MIIRASAIYIPTALIPNSLVILFAMLETTFPRFIYQLTSSQVLPTGDTAGD